MKRNCQIILNILKNEFDNGFCTQHEYDILKGKINKNAENNTTQWQKFIKDIIKLSGGTYIELGQLIKLLKPPLDSSQKKQIHKKNKIKEEHSDFQFVAKKEIRKESVPKQKPDFTEQEKQKFDYTNIIQEEEQKEKQKRKQQVTKKPSILKEQKNIIRNDNISFANKTAIDKYTIYYYLPFPDPKGFFWDDKKTTEVFSGSAYLLKIVNNTSNTGKYTLLTKNEKIVKNAIINQKAFLQSVCNIIEHSGSNNIIVVEEGILNKVQNRWYPVTENKLKIKII